jgi:sugar phosphate isomerase/epimerase
MIGGREVALAILGVLGTPPPEVAQVARDAGFDSITLRLIGGNRERPDQPEAYPLIGDTPQRRETVARLKELGIGMLDVEVLRLKADTDMETVKPTLESAQALGAKHLLAVGLDADEAGTVAKFAELCETAQPYGVRPALEFMRMSSVTTVQDADRIVAAAGHPAGVVLVDPLHLRRSGGSPADVAALAAAHPERYPYFQLCDGPLAAPGEDRIRDLMTEAVTNRLSPGDGELPLIELIRAMPAGAAVSVEAPLAAFADRSPADKAAKLIAGTRRVLEQAG